MRIAIKWGAVLALGIILWTIAVHLLGFYTDRVQYATLVDTIVLVLPIGVLTMALLEFRRSEGGALPFGRALLLGLGVAAVSAPFTVAFLWYYHHHVNPDWVSYLTAYEEQKLAAQGVAPAEIANAVTRLQQGGTDRAQITGGLIGTLVMGLLVTVLVTAVLKLLPRPTGKAA